MEKCFLFTLEMGTQALRLLRQSKNKYLTSKEVEAKQRTSCLFSLLSHYLSNGKQEMAFSFLRSKFFKVNWPEMTEDTFF